MPEGRAQQVPNSAGTAPPRLKAPANACDCHHHIYDPARFPPPPNPNPRRPMPSSGAVPDYRLLQKRIGTTRSVVVQPRHYVIDLLSVWAPDEATRTRILVRNPETLYGFAKAA